MHRLHKSRRELVYQGLALFENSTSVKDFRFLPPTLWAGASGLMTWVNGFLKKHAVGKSSVISISLIICCGCFKTGLLFSCLDCYRPSQLASFIPIASTLLTAHIKLISQHPMFKWKPSDSRTLISSSLVFGHQFSLGGLFLYFKCKYFIECNKWGKIHLLFDEWL